MVCRKPHVPEEGSLGCSLLWTHGDKKTLSGNVCLSSDSHFCQGQSQQALMLWRLGLAGENQPNAKGHPFLSAAQMKGI